jgi:hypothetical protein
LNIQNILNIRFFLPILAEKKKIPRFRLFENPEKNELFAETSKSPNPLSIKHFENTEISWIKKNVVLFTADFYYYSQLSPY